ncbi:sensor histidine kinase, partial [Streptomyces sp. SID5926]|nr:sensor histidine kinase [Streptomyces sp. SID5926]
VVDDGTGFDPDALPPPDPEAGGFGLAAMRARLDALGGTLSIESAPGHGTALAARLPLVPPTEPEAHP